MTYNFALGKLLVATTFRWFHEFDVENRLEDDGVYFTATIPLAGARPAKQSEFGIGKLAVTDIVS